MLRWSRAVSHGTRVVAAIPVPGTSVPDRGSGTARIVRPWPGCCSKQTGSRAEAELPALATRRQQDPPSSLPMAISAVIAVDWWHLVQWCVHPPLHREVEERETVFGLTLGLEVSMQTAQYRPQQQLPLFLSVKRTTAAAVGQVTRDFRYYKRSPHKNIAPFRVHRPNYPWIMIQPSNQTFRRGYTPLRTGNLKLSTTFRVPRSSYLRTGNICDCGVERK